MHQQHILLASGKGLKVATEVLLRATLLGHIQHCFLIVT
jgi:hypothetical protein